MSTFYNEFDEYPAQWLRNLIEAGEITQGVVDERSIKEIRADELTGYTRQHFFAGIAGWDLALQLAGWPEDREVWTGSCPCQPFSQAGKGRGFDDERHLWPAWYELIKERRPPTIFGEQVASKDGRIWLDRVRTDLEAVGYAVGAADLCAASINAPHIRQRLWWVAYAKQPQSQGSIYRYREDGKAQTSRETTELTGLCEDSRVDIPHSDGHGRPEEAPPTVKDSDRSDDRISIRASAWDNYIWIPCGDGKARRIEPGLAPLAHGVPARVGKIRSYGNAIVPQVAAEFIKAAMEAR